MRRSTHLAAGLLLGIILFKSPEPILSLTIGADMPDIIDSPYSVPNRIGLHIRHRGVFHSILIAIIMYAAYKIFFMKYPIINANNIVIPFIYGYLLHIFLDSFTISGTQPFLPFIRKKIHLGNMRTGSIEDMALGIIFLSLFVLICAKVL